MSENFKIEASGERTIPKGEGPGDLQVSEPRSGWVAHRRSLSYVEERFYPITKILDFAAIRNRYGLLEWTHNVINYIANQHEHHTRKTFKEEYREFLEKYDVEYDERYVWD